MHIFLKGRLSILHLLSGPSRNPVKITVKTSCLSNGTAYIQSKNLEYNYDMVDKIQPVCNERSEMAFYNKTTGFCENVIVKVNYDFKVVPGQITELTITFVLTSVPLRQSYFTQNKKRDENTDLYLFQSYSVQFNPLESKTFAPNGYHLEEQILLYNISSEDDECTGSNKCKNKPASTKHTVWTKDGSKDNESLKGVRKIQSAQLKAFGGENCDEETLVTFGYNVMKTCLISFESELTCEEQRKAILKILDNYLNFNAVDDGFGNAIPHIREGCTDRASSELDLETNSTECRIPKGIQFRALYSPVRNRSARFKIVGFHSNLWSGKCTPTMCHLSWSISFSEAKPRSLQSRWMEYMLSPIGSSYSWANLLSHNLNLESQRIDKFGTQGFRLILVLAFIVIILRFDY
ncbi:uncharacterized protein LOC112126113 isoform X1 [Cimex lectularius]|uniref:Uncharacterized protein n=1 Tax=Cimex lectularius TaxID=79782 RepID=A0A8I6SP29_CIMLE|nr:uncharacterized protein LOC112126113 isoform X1 [Cimex lectularius]